MEVHPAASVFPMFSDEELRDLADDIKANGLQQPIVVSDGVLIDGRNRLAACEIAGVEPSFVELNGSDPVAFILSANLARRHMSKGQRAMAGAKVLADSNLIGKKAADIVGVNTAYIDYARTVLEFAPEDADLVLAGTLALNEAYARVQERKKAAKRQAADRERLRELAPDLDEAVSNEVLELTAALEEARERERKAKENRQVLTRNLIDALNLIDTKDQNPDDVANVWVDELLPSDALTADRLRRVARTLEAVAKRMDR